MLRPPSTKCFSFRCLSIGYIVGTLIWSRQPMRERQSDGPMAVKMLWRRRLWVMEIMKVGVKYLGRSAEATRCTGVDATSTTSFSRTPEWSGQPWERLLETGKRFCSVFRPIKQLTICNGVTFISYFVDRASRYKFLVMTNLTHFFMYLFISRLYMFRASQRSSSGDRIVLIHHLVWLVCVSECLVCRSGGNRISHILHVSRVRVNCKIVADKATYVTLNFIYWILWLWNIINYVLIVETE